MTRKLILTLEDVEKNKSISGATTVDEVNYFYNLTGLNGVTEILLRINEQMNKELGENVKISIPAPISSIPPGKQW